MATLREILDNYRLPVTTGIKASLDALDWCYDKVGLSTKETDGKVVSCAKSVIRRIPEVPIVYMTSSFTSSLGFVYNSCAAGYNTIIAVRSYMKAEDASGKTIAKDQLYSATKNALCAGVDYLMMNYVTTYNVAKIISPEFVAKLESPITQTVASKAQSLIGKLPEMVLSSEVIKKIGNLSVRKAVEMANFPIRAFVREINLPTLVTILSPELVRKAYNGTFQTVDSLLKRAVGARVIAVAVPVPTSREKFIRAMRTIRQAVRLVKEQQQPQQPPAPVMRQAVVLNSRELPRRRAGLKGEFRRRRASGIIDMEL